MLLTSPRIALLSWLLVVLALPSPAQQQAFSPTSLCPAIELSPHYVGEVFSNTRGGISTKNATRYLGLFDLDVRIDLDQTIIPVPGRFLIRAQTTHGEGLSNRFVGDTQVLSNIDSQRDITQVTEYAWEFDLGDQIRVRIGKQDVNHYFLRMDSAEDFIHSAFGLSPASGLPSYPDTSMAIVARKEFSDQLRMKLGVWDTLASGGSWGISGNEIFLTLFETEYDYHWNRLPGTIALGIGNGSGGNFAGARIPVVWGAYVQLEQMVYREVGDPSQGLWMFGQYFPTDSADDLPLTTIPEDAAAGLVYQGLLPGRDEDAVGLGIAWARLDQGGNGREIATEFFYKFQLNSQLSVQPDLQSITSPSGIFRDSLVVGLRIHVTL